MLRIFSCLPFKGALALASAIGVPASSPFDWTEKSTSTIEFDGSGVHFRFEIARGRRALFARTLPVSVRVTMDGVDAFRSLALLVGRDDDGDGVVRQAEWQLVRAVKPIVADGKTIAVIEPVEVDDSHGTIRVTWIVRSGAAWCEEWSDGGLTYEEPPPLPR